MTSSFRPTLKRTLFTAVDMAHPMNALGAGQRCNAGGMGTRGPATKPEAEEAPSTSRVARVCAHVATSMSWSASACAWARVAVTLERPAPCLP